jgi:isopentenyldiphosphate isomerase
VIIDESEIAAWRFVDLSNLELDLNAHPERFTPWFKIQWEQLKYRVAFNATDFDSLRGRKPGPVSGL